MHDAVEELLHIAAQDEVFQVAAREHEKFQELTKLPAWVSLEEHVRKVSSKSLEQIASWILHSDDVVPQRKIDFMRGYVKGMLAVADLPGSIDKDFDHQIEKAWRRATRAAEISGEITEQEAVDAVSQ